MSDPQWAPDPYGRFELRYWDGATWTGHVHHQGVPGLDPLPAQPTGRPAAQHEDAWPLGRTDLDDAGADLFPGTHHASGSPGFDAYVQQGQDGRTGRRGQHGRTTASRRGRGPLVAVGAAGAALLGVVVLGVAALGGGQDAAVLTGASGTSTQQGFAAVPTSSAPPAAASPAGRATTAPAARASTSKRATTSTTTQARTTTTTAPKATTMKPRTTTSAPRTTTTKPRTTKPSTTKPSTTTPATTVKTYKNCTAMHVDHPHGVGRPGAVDSTSGTPVTTFVVDKALYLANRSRDADDDGIACEKR